MPMREKTVADSRTETIHIIQMEDLNSAGRLFGGTLMKWIDEAAAIVARRHCEMNITTVSVDHLNFMQGVYAWEMVVIIATATYVGHTSMEVKVDSYVERINGERVLINQAYLTEVGIDEQDKPTPIPALIYSNQEEKDECYRACIRKEMRKKQKSEMEEFQHLTKLRDAFQKEETDS